MIYLIDSAVILNDIQFAFSPSEKYLTTSKVIAEIKDFRSRAVVDNAFQQNLLKIEEPSPNTIEKIRKKAKDIGMKLSKADISLIALAFEYKNKKEKIKVITDDYSVQNMLPSLGIPFSSVIRGEIKEEIEFEKICTGCGKKYKGSYVEDICDICGSRLKRVRKKSN